MATKAIEKDTEITIMEITRERFECCILGTTPLILNRMSEKAMRELLMPKGKKTAAEKQSSMKHDPLAEFAASPYRMRSPSADTLLGLLPTAFKGAMCNAALDIPGMKKTQIGRLVYIPGEMLEVYGTPKLFMSVVRSADQNRTPDIRTRCILPEWAVRLSVEFTTPILRRQSVVNLLAAAGITIGVGDWRQQKGSGNYGLFSIVDPDHPDFVRITTHAKRNAQIEAMDLAEPHDQETADLLSWWAPEAKRRGFKVAA